MTTNITRRFVRTTLVLLFVFCISLTTTSAKGWNNDANHAEFFINLGSSGYSFNNEYAASNKLGYSLGGSVTFFNRSQWGIKTGLRYSVYQTELNLDGETFTTPSIDSEDDAFNLISTFSNLKENLQTSYIQLPITVQYRYEISRDFGFLPELGVMLFSSLATNSEINGGTYTTVGSYPSFGEFTILDGMPGAGTYSPTQTDKYYTWNFGASLLGSFQAYYALSKKLLITGGFTFDYQLSPNTTSSQTSLVDYEITSYKTATCNYNSILSTDDAGRYHKMFIGLKFGLIYKWN